MESEIMSCCEDQRMNRRDFVTTAAAAAAGLGVLGAAGGTPAAMGQATTQPAAGAGLDVGPKSGYVKDGPVTTWVHTNHVIVMRQDGKLFAMTSKCTHKHCDVKDAGGSLHCPCHNSNFAYDGSATDGPATRGGPLPRFGISVNDAGNVIVDTKKVFKQDQWTDPASFVTVA
jgi:cytochrome b6-f complex iron-sulfur subunit